MKRRKYTGPLIAQELVGDYLHRPLESFDWVKRLKRADLVSTLNGFRFSAKYKPFLHQLQCFVLGIELPQFCFFLDMGAGKTGLVLALVRWHKRHSNLGRTLVLVPREVTIQTWIDEIELHAPELSYVALLGTPAERKRLLLREKDIYLLNYPGLQLLMSDLVPVPKKRERQIVPRLAKNFAKRFDMVVADECHHLGNHLSLTYRECRWLSKFCHFRYGLTGTPFGRDPTPLWAQFHVIDDGETLGDTLGLFRAVFFNAKDNYWGGVDYVFDGRMEQELHRMLKHRSIYFASEEFSDLPPLRPAQRVKVNFSLPAHEQYRNVVRKIKEAHGSLEEIKNAFVRMRMCTSGFMSVKSDIEGRLTMYFEENPKLEMLEEMVSDIPLSSKCLIYHEFILTGKMIGRMLARKKLHYATLSGQTKDQIGEMRKFLHDDKVRFLVANNESGSESINPQHVANYGIFFESPVSPRTRKQAEKRLHRQGQTKPVFLYDLIVPGSIDERILEFHAEGKDLFDAIIRGEVKLEDVV